MYRLLLSTTILALLFSCNTSSKVDVEDTSELHQGTEEEINSIMETFILAEEGSTINLPAGFYEMPNQLILDATDNVLIKGAGMDKTILSFKTLTTGGEGMKISGSNNTVLQDFTIYDAPGDGLKSQKCENITFRKINMTWTNGDKSENGTYALYPVQCKNVMIDGCVASHSRDAGIYVGQSENIIVKNCHAFGNVAGIEIENSDNAEVYDNLAEDNTGGILVFNLPGLPKAYGTRTKIYNNTVINNNHKNFADEGGIENGNAVSQIPPGTGMLVLAGKDIEIYGNEIKGNKTVGIAIINYHITQLPFEITDDGWVPFTSNVYIHDNTYERPMTPPDLSKQMGQLLSAKNAYGVGKTQDIIYDGIWDDANGDNILDNPQNICIQEEEIADLHFTLFELSENISEIKAFKNYEPFVCEHSFETDASTILSEF